MGFKIVECYDPVTLTKGRNFTPGKFAPPPPSPPVKKANLFSSAVTPTNIALFQATFNLRRPRRASFADIATIFIGTTFKDSNKVKRNRNYALKCNLYLYFLI